MSWSGCVAALCSHPFCWFVCVSAIICNKREMRANDPCSAPVIHHTLPLYTLLHEIGEYQTAQNMNYCIHFTFILIFQNIFQNIYHLYMDNCKLFASEHATAQLRNRNRICVSWLESNVINALTYWRLRWKSCLCSAAPWENCNDSSRNYLKLSEPVSRKYFLSIPSWKYFKMPLCIIRWSAE